MAEKFLLALQEGAAPFSDHETNPVLHGVSWTAGYSLHGRHKGDIVGVVLTEYTDLWPTFC